jgi:dihydroorotase
MKQFDWLIHGGRVVDPANGIDAGLDVALAGGKIAAVEAGLDPGTAQQTFDARGKIVTPGLVDLHTHTYDLVTPLGIDADHYCLGRGVTTAVDTGSAGSDTFPGFRKFSAERFRTRVLGFLNISRAGLAVGGATDKAAPGELDSPKFISADECVACIEANRDLLIGVKVRLSASIADDGANEPLAWEQAQAAAAATNTPLMVHHTLSSIPLERSPGEMKTGDVYTHCFHGYESTIIDPETRNIHPAVRAARDRGVIFDIGHGMGSFSWTVAEICAAQGFWPDTISTDMHSLTCEGPGYDLPTVMSKLLHLGMPLTDVIAASTINAAQAIGWHDRVGTLGVARDADVCVMSFGEVDVQMEDCQGQLRPLSRRLKTEAVWRAGENVATTEPIRWPNPEKAEKAKQGWPNLVIRDAAPP